MWVQQETILFLEVMKYAQYFFGLNYVFASLILHLSILIYQWEMGLGELVAFLQYWITNELSFASCRKTFHRNNSQGGKVEK